MIIDTIASESLTATSADINSISNPDDIGKYSELIDKFGSATVILSVFIVVLLVALFIIMKSMITANKQIKDQQKTMLEIIIKNQEESKKPVKEKNIVGTFVKIDDSIKDVLRTISKSINADRLSVYVFHNGTHSSHGLPFFKTSCVSEIIKKNCGIGKRAFDHSHLALSLIDDSIKEVYKYGKLEVKNIKEIKNKFPVLHHMLEEVQIVSATGVAIYDQENMMLGIIVAEYITDKSDDISDITTKLIDETKCLSPILEFSDYQSLNGPNDNE